MPPQLDDVARSLSLAIAFLLVAVLLLLTLDEPITVAPLIGGAIGLNVAVLREVWRLGARVSPGRR